MSERAAQKILTTARAHTSKTHKISFGSVGWWKSNIHPTYVCSLVCLSICLSFFFIDSATMLPLFLPLCVCVTLFMHSTIRKLGIFAGFQPIDIGFIPIAILKLLFDASREFWWRKQLQYRIESYAKETFLKPFECNDTHAHLVFKSVISFYCFFFYFLRTHCEQRRLEIRMIMMMVTVHHASKAKSIVFCGKRWEKKVWHLLIRWFA